MTDAFRIYTICTVLLFFKMAGQSIAQVISRMRAKRYTNAEDATFFGVGSAAPEDTPLAKRLQRCWSNDLENIPIFLILAWLYIQLPEAASGAKILLPLFVLARYAHTFFYSTGKQPWRTIAFNVCWIVMFALSFSLIRAALS